VLVNDVWATLVVAHNEPKQGDHEGLPYTEGWGCLVQGRIACARAMDSRKRGDAQVARRRGGFVTRPFLRV
jgi:hypothetical protein